MMPPSTPRVAPARPEGHCRKEFNAGLDAKATRPSISTEGDKIDERALKALVRAAVAYYNSASQKK